MICVNSVRVYPSSITLIVSNWSYAAYAKVCPSNADCKEVQWHSDNPSVASVNASSGYIYANKVGTAHIYATATDGSGCSDCLTVMVSNTVPVTSVTLNRSDLSLEEGQCASLSATVCPDNATNKNVNWTSSNNGVATVKGGVVTAAGKGSARITATATDGSCCCDCCTVSVTGDVLVTNVSVSPSCKSLTVGATYYLHETVTPSNATNKTVSWCSSNTSVATVNPNSGLVTAQGAGTATIYATAQDGSGNYGTCSISVNSVYVTSISVSPKQKTLSKDEATTLSAAVFPCGASNSVKWTSSDTSVATVEADTGKVRAKSEGTAIITARSVNGNKTDTCTITVDSREKVIVEKDSNRSYNKIVFENGKTWNCINFDIINDYSLNMNDPFSQRFYDNTYQRRVADEGSGYVHYYEPMKEYTDEEIKLIYTIDPHGLAAYVKEYARQLFRDGNSVQDSLKRMLDYKDDIFYLLFKHHPKYYRRGLDGTWYETTDKSDLKEVLSESEFLFGQHQIYDDLTLQAFITVVIDIFSMAIQCPALKSLTIISKIAKVVDYYSLARSVAESVLNGDFNGFVSAVANGIVDEDKLDEDFITPAEYKTKNYTLGWAFELLSFSSDLGTLADTFRNGPHFYKEIFTHCIDDLNYNIMIRTTDNKLISISDINNVIE